MSNPNINLKSINYDSIYNDIVNYIKSQSDFKDFDFEGSALSTIIDLLSYNTFYQIVFQNIIVNEMFLDTSQKLDSVISHAKLHGYTVSPRKSSTSSLSVINNISVGDVIPAYTRFQGKKTNGEIKVFYNLKPITTTTDANGQIIAGPFDVYEGNQVVQNAIFQNTGTKTSINVSEQSIFIPESNLDINTLKVEVKVGTIDAFEEYDQSSTILPSVNVEDKFFFLERRGDGYKLVFGSFIDELTGEVSPNKLTDESKVRISYIVSSGDSGNGCSSFSFINPPSSFTNSRIITNSGLSKGGFNEPNLEALKSFIPRAFAAQERVVTKEDIKVLLVNSGLATQISKVTVETTDEESTIPLGEVYFRIEDVADSDPAAQTAETLINNKGMAGINYIYGTFIQNLTGSQNTDEQLPESDVQNPSTPVTVNNTTSSSSTSSESTTTSTSTSSSSSNLGGSGY